MVVPITFRYRGDVIVTENVVRAWAGASGRDWAIRLMDFRPDPTRRAKPVSLVSVARSPAARRPSGGRVQATRSGSQDPA